VIIRTFIFKFEFAIVNANNGFVINEIGKYNVYNGIVSYYKGDVEILE